MNNKRILICAPRGGLNDTFCQIEKSWSYAERWGRRLYIEPEGSGLFGFLWEVFEEQTISNSKNTRIIIQGREDAFAYAKQGTLKQDVLKRYYDASFDHEAIIDYNPTANAFIPVDARDGLTFDFFRDHQEDILLHLAFGGGEESRGVVNRLRLCAEVSAYVQSRLAHLPGDYIALHVRCTDRASYYQRFIAGLKPSLEGQNVLICSDNQAVIEYARRSLTGCVLFDTGVKRSDSRSSIHEAMADPRVDRELRYAALLDVITDLVALGGGSQVHVAPTFTEYGTRPLKVLRNRVKRTLGLTPTSPSGFSRLAQYLSDNKDVLERFVGNGVAE